MSFFTAYDDDGGDDIFLLTSATSPPTVTATTTTATATTDIYQVVNHLSDRQEKVLSLLFVFSGLLSILGSSTIVMKVVKNRRQATPYDRLMLGLSSCDWMASLGWILTPFLLPNDTSPRVWAIGTDGTCTILGAISQFGFCAIAYNCILSLYYLITIRFQVKRQTIAASGYEVWIHVIVIGYFVITSVGGAIVGVYRETDLGMGCWVNDWPEGCEVDNSCKSAQIGWAFGAGPLLFTLLTLIVNNTVIYIYVKRVLSSSSSSATTTTTTTTTNKPKHSSTSTSRSSLSSSSSSFVLSDRDPPTPSSGMTSKQALEVILRERQQREQERSAHRQRYISEVATQGFLYVGTFFLAYTSPVVIRYIEVYGTYPLSEAPLFPLLVLNSILLPLQGFFNMFVYNRPSFTRVRDSFPEQPLWWTIKTACLDTNIPRLLESSRVQTKSGPGGGPNHHPNSRNNNRSSSGKGFSSDLCMVQEVSQEEDDDDDDDNDSFVQEYVSKQSDDENDYWKEDRTGKTNYLGDSSSQEEGENGADTEDGGATKVTRNDLQEQGYDDGDDDAIVVLVDRPRSVPNFMTGDDDDHGSDDDMPVFPSKPRSVPNINLFDNHNNILTSDDYSDIEEFDLDEEYRKIFEQPSKTTKGRKTKNSGASMGSGSSHRISFDGSVHHNNNNNCSSVGGM